MTSAEQINEIAKAVIAKDYDFDYVGLRVQESDYGLTVGQTIEYCSRYWIDGEMTDDEIDGICAVDTKLAARQVLSFGAYVGSTILVLGSNRAQYGEDDGEIIMNNPVVIDIINR